MPDVDIKSYVKKLNYLIEKIREYKDFKNKLIKSIEKLDKDYREKKIDKKRYRVALKNILKGKKRIDLISYYNSMIIELLSKIEKCSEDINNKFKTIESVKKPSPEKKIVEEKETLVAPIPEIKAVKLDKETLLKYLRDVNLELDDVKRFAQPKKESFVKETEYTVYESSHFGKFSNSCVEKLTFYFIKKFPKFFKDLSKTLRFANVKVFSRTYVSIMIFSGLLGFFLTTLFFLILSSFYTTLTLLNILKSIGLGFLGGAAIAAIMYAYPFMVVKNREKGIRNELPFVILHMAAVAGSGARPISMFNLVLSTGEYKWLEAEIKRIVNYVNLFGYDLNTALRVVSSTTPSPEFKELLNGIVTTTEMGGSLKEYLKGKAEDSMTTYRLERKKFTEVLSTYSDIYIGILIAAPLLFFTALAIINMPMLGGAIFGLKISSLAIFGTYVAIPFLNIIFLIFLSVIQPK